MKMALVSGRGRGFTRTDLLVVSFALFVVAVFFVLFLSSPDRNGKARAFRIQCVNNLKQVGVGFNTWESDHNNKYPMDASETNGGTMELISGPDAFRHFQIMSNELDTPKILYCFADTERVRSTTFNLKPVPGVIPFTSNSNLSYFVRLDATDSDPNGISSGDRNLTNGTPLRNGILELTTNHPAGWTSELHNKLGNILLADGSVQQVSTMGLPELITNTPAFTNRLLMPILGP